MVFRRKRRNIRYILSVLKIVKIATLPSLRVVEVQGLIKKVDIYVALGSEEKKELEEIMNGKTKVQNEYIMHSFATKDITNMTNMCVWYEDKVSLLFLT